MKVTKTCRKCKESKGKDEFSYSPKGSVGVCKACNLKRIQGWQTKNPGKRQETGRRYYNRNRDRVRKYIKVDEWAKKLFQAAKGRARKSPELGPTTITESWILAQPMVCPYLGIPLELSEQIRGLRQPSLDRIDNSKGYTPENTRLTSLAWNQMRNVSSVEDALHLVADIRLTALLREVA